MLGCAAGLVALSWIRWLFVAHPSPDHAALRFPGDLLAAASFVALVLFALRAHLQLVSRQAGPAEQGLREAVGLAVVASGMLPLLSGDLFSVLAYADLFAKGSVDPFTLPPPGLLATRFLPFVSPAWRQAPCVYGPLQLYFWWPAALPEQGLASTLALAKLLALAASAATLVLLHRYCSRPDGPGPAAFGVAALSPVLWIEGAGQAHNDVVAGLLLAAWLLVARRPGVVLASALLGCAMASKLTAALPAGLFLAYLAGRPGPRAERARNVALAVLALALVLVLAYLPFWRGLETLRVPLEFLARRRPTNGLLEVAFVGLRPFVGTAAATSALSALSTLLTAGLALLGAALAWRAPDFPALVGVMARICLLATTLAATAFHAWYLIPCLVLSVEMRDPVWRGWLLRFGALSLLTDGAVLFAHGSIAREGYTVLAVAVVVAASLWRLRARLARLSAASGDAAGSPSGVP